MSQGQWDLLDSLKNEKKMLKMNPGGAELGIFHVGG